MDQIVVAHLTVLLCVCVYTQRKVPDQDVAQGSYIALPLTLLLLLAAYNHEKVQKHFTHPDDMFSWSKPDHPTSCRVHLLLSPLTYRVSLKIRQGFSFSPNDTPGLIFDLH